MSDRYEEMRKNKRKIMDELGAALKKEFNNKGLHVSAGIINSDDHDYAIRIVDRNDPDNAPDEKVIEFAEKKMQEILPGSKPQIVGMAVPRVRAPGLRR